MALEVLEHDGGPARRGNSLEYPADDGRDFPARINFFLDVMKLAPNLERGQVLAEILVGHIEPPVTESRGRSGSIGMLLDPVPGDVHPAADPHGVVALHVVEEARECGGSPWPAHQPHVEPDRH